MPFDRRSAETESRRESESFSRCNSPISTPEVASRRIVDRFPARRRPVWHWQIRLSGGQARSRRLFAASSPGNDSCPAGSNRRGGDRGASRRRRTISRSNPKPFQMWAVGAQPVIAWDAASDIRRRGAFPGQHHHSFRRPLFRHRDQSRPFRPSRLAASLFESDEA